MRPGFFSKEYLQAIPNDNLEAWVYLYHEFARFMNSANKPGNHANLLNDELIEILAIFRAFSKTRELDVDLPNMNADRNKNAANIVSHLMRLGEAWSVELSKRSSTSLFVEKTDHYVAVFDSAQAYVFTDNDLGKIQELTNELRGLITSNNLITADHKRRLLRRLEAMQNELHKHTSDVDRFWGFIAEAGIVARKFGEDLKPITDRATELGKIVIAVVMAKEGIKALPEITKLLGH